MKNKCQLTCSFFLSSFICLFLPCSLCFGAEQLELQNRRPEYLESARKKVQTAEPGQTVQEGQTGQTGKTVTRPQGPVIILPQVSSPNEPTSPTVITPIVPEPKKPDAPKTEEPAQPNIIEHPKSEQIPEIVIPKEPENPKVEEPEKITPKESDKKLLTPEAFLPTTPDKSKENKGVKDAQNKKEPDNKPEAKVKKEDKAKVNVQEEQKAVQEEKKTGEPLKIPEQAKKNKDLSFLEGCWVGTRPEYHTKRIITERFCFGKDGVGKRFILDPGYAGQCVGATRAAFNQGGVLRMQSERMYCTDVGENWGASEMTCEGEGEKTPCTWVFHDVGGARQSYSINFVRE